MNQEASLDVRHTIKRILAAIATLAIFACGARVADRKAPRKDRGMNPGIAAAMADFKSHPRDRMQPAKNLLTMIEPGQTPADVQALLGPPSLKQSDYALFYSSTLVVTFDTANKVSSITSDLADEVVQTSGDKADPEIVAAAQQFRSQPYSRQDPARKLIPLIKARMPIEEVETLLGPPNRRSWEYSLAASSPPSLVVRFDEKDKVREAAIFPPQ